MDQYFLVLLGTGLYNKEFDHCCSAELRKGLDIVADQILRTRKEKRCQNGGSYLEDPLLSLIQCRHHIYLALTCSQQLQLELQGVDVDDKSLDILNPSDWLADDDDGTITQTKHLLKMLASRQSVTNNCLLDQKHSPINDGPADNEDDSDDDDDVAADHIHHLAGLLPVKGSAIINVYWILPEQHNLNTRNTLPIFGAIKRLQHYNNALVNIVTTNKMSSDGFLDSWKKWLNFNVLDMTTPLALGDVPLWHGCLTCVGLQKKPGIVLPGFTLTSDSSTQMGLDLTFDKSDSSFLSSTCSSTHLNPEIQILRYIPRESVPLYLLLPIKLKLHLEYKNEKASQTFLDDLHNSCNKGLGLLACISLVTKSETETPGQSLESWMDLITSSAVVSTSSDVSPAHQVLSGLTNQSSSEVKRLCLVSNEEPDHNIVYLFRHPSSLNGKIYEYLQYLTRGKKVIDDQTDSKLHIEDLSDRFSNTKRECSSAYTKEVINKIEKIKGEENEISCQALERILSSSASDISLPLSKSLHRPKKIEIEFSSATEHKLQSDGMIPPSKWPERLWLMQNDPAELAAREAKKKVTLPIEEVLSMDVKDILRKFHSDGRPVKENLSPLRYAYKTEGESHILINTTEVGIRQAGYPEALTIRYHGVEYCLDSRDALSKDIQIAGIQTSNVKQETLSSYAALNSKRLETKARNVQRVTRSKDKDRPGETSADVKKINPQKRPRKRASPNVKQDTTRQLRKRKRSDSPKQQDVAGGEKCGPPKGKETRSQRHKRRLRLVVEKTLAEHGIDNNNDLFPSCSERMYTLIKSFLKDLKSSHGLNDTMRDLAQTNVDQVINFEKTRLNVQ